MRGVRERVALRIAPWLYRTGEPEAWLNIAKAESELQRIGRALIAEASSDGGGMTEAECLLADIAAYQARGVEFNAADLQKAAASYFQPRVRLTPEDDARR